ncbi:cobalamin biosynthesis protein [Streptomyces sp. ECR3]|uniref:cobalamin biosynthesis protein n=1 Tax=Streptomyces sp. ECR3 TaxID=3400630 RepID=UPI003F1DD9B7
MGAERLHAYGATAGLLGDLLLGDPRRGHPVAVFGRAAAAVERVLWRDHRGWGALHTLVCAGGATALGALAVRAVRHSPAASLALTASATWAVLGGTSLIREARAVGRALESGDVDAARARLPHLCGRDPQALDAEGIARAVVESVAENTSDAVVGALVWGAVAGVPGLLGFRAVNTLDAMVGHRSVRHLRFGWASARLDDLAGAPGARLTAAFRLDPVRPGVFEGRVRLDLGAARLPVHGFGGVRHPLLRLHHQDLTNTGVLLAPLTFPALRATAHGGTLPHALTVEPEGRGAGRLQVRWTPVGPAARLLPPLARRLSSPRLRRAARLVRGALR